MAKKERKVNFANLTIKFGRADLLDYIEVVSRAFLMASHVRNTKSGSYFFLKTKIKELEENNPQSVVIYGRIVKHTKLTREQVIQGEELVENVAHIENSPSAFFVLFLSDHRIAYVPETKYAPSLKNFEAAVSLFVKREFKAFSKEIYRARKSEDAGFTWGKFYEEHVPPTVNVVPLASPQGVKAFISKFDSINRITVHLLERNQDSEGRSIFEQLLDDTTPMNPTSAKYEVRAGGEGLKIENTKEFVSDATHGGYERVSIEGKDHTGAKLVGSNDTYKMSVATKLSDVDSTRARQLRQLYEDQKERGNIKVGPRDEGFISNAISKIWGNV
ncbi:hypothetical protein JMK10_00260 [Rhodovulum sulfidophilum]|uniref:hypothetical protein n=1 Tax=Rhodovulum sulfidophilum TaxID=35806 RepID=UPI0019210B48|nr:hypothetical protein [Rhodovulum sulfidophilum]MBL3575596.1 hypothetical protein [Rhodovulum sulfidophilum]MCE8431775.1 hypothetical protein [Rhodovulum sulfidophilum]MCF4115295.1 hypothetical protein [Rhodovulum sulfidophilum]